MIVIDSSAVVAIFRLESDAQSYAARIAEDDEPAISAATVLETSIVLRSLKHIAADVAERWLDQFLAEASVRLEPVDATQIALARLAHARYGRGSGHAAQLNFGDCFAYALARALDAPLLFKGAHFAHTDVRKALAA